MEIAVYSGVILAAYLLGSIPSGYLAGKARGVDLRTVGSGNIGATNTFRVLGRNAGVIVLLADAFKGFASARWLAVVALWMEPEARGRIDTQYLSLAAGAAAVLGHNYTCWLRFKGGKGIATSCGVVIALVPAAAIIILLTWGLVLLITRYVSVASITAAIVLPLATWLTRASPVMVGLMAALGLLAILKHRGNISRLLAGTESRVGRRKAEIGTETSAHGGNK